MPKLPYISRETLPVCRYIIYLMIWLLGQGIGKEEGEETRVGEWQTLSIRFSPTRFESNSILYSPSRKSSNSIGASLYLTGRGSPNLVLHLLAATVGVDYPSRNNIQNILSNVTPNSSGAYKASPIPSGVYTIMAGINGRKTTCKNPLCRFVNCPSGKFRPGKLNSARETDDAREQMVKPAWISLNKSLAVAPSPFSLSPSSARPTYFLSLFFLSIFLFPSVLMRMHLHALVMQVYADAF